MNAFIFEQDRFIEDKTSKFFYLKISSRDANILSPFDFHIKFNMDIGSQNNQFKQEAVIYNKYIDIKSIELSDIVIPRYIPSFVIGNNYDGVNLVLKNTNMFMLSCYPGITLKSGSTTINSNTVNYIKLINPKETIIIIKTGYTLDNTNIENNHTLKCHKIIDHININNTIYPIIDVSNNYIIVDNFFTPLPSSTKLVLGNYYSNLLTVSDNTNISITPTTLIINDLPSEMLQNIYEGNILNISDLSNNNYYFKVTDYVDNSNNANFKGTWFNKPETLSDVLYVTLFGYGSRDLLDDRIFYVEMNPFVPVKSTATNTDLNRMFGVLFPSTQSREWLYLSGEPKEIFLQRDYRKLDRIDFKFFDSNGNNLNEIFNKKLGLLNTNYYNNLYTSIVIKVEENDRILVTK
jgi:hypothetical protein